jgi:hypothetical protein
MQHAWIPYYRTCYYLVSLINGLLIKNTVSYVARRLDTITTSTRLKSRLSIQLWLRLGGGVLIGERQGLGGIHPYSAQDKVNTEFVAQRNSVAQDIERRLFDVDMNVPIAWFGIRTRRLAIRR